jgi:hypothetical protein
MNRKVMVDGPAMWPSEVVEKVTLRRVGREEEGRWKALIGQHHDLGPNHRVGETILHVAEVDEHRAVVGWCAPALEGEVRDRWIGWSARPKQRRLKSVAQNGRFLLLLEAQAVPNLASRVLALSVRRLAGDAGLRQARHAR